MSIEQVGKFNFAAEEQQDRGIDRFSKGVAEALLRANEMCKKAHRELLSRRLNRGQFREVAIGYNQAAREYNQQRQKLIDLGNGFGETRQLYGIEEKLRTAAAQLQSITDTLKASPRIPQRDDEASKKSTTNEKQSINWQRLALLGSAGLSMVILPSCAAAEIVQIENQKPTDPAEESVPTVESETNPGSLIDPTPSPEVVPSPTTDPLQVNINFPSDLNQQEIQNLQEGTENFTQALEDSLNKNPSLKQEIYAEGGLMVAFDPNNLIVKNGVEAYFAPKGGALSNNLLLIGENREIRFHSMEGANALLGTNFSEKEHKLDFAADGKTKLGIGIIQEIATGDIKALTSSTGQWSLPENSGYTQEELAQFAESGKKSGESAVQMAREDIPWEEMSFEQQKAKIKAEYANGISQGIEIPGENKLIYYDGKDYRELYALWAFSDEAVPMGSIYDINNPDDVKFLKEVVLGNNPQRIEGLTVDYGSYQVFKDNMEYIQFYPDNNTWDFSEEVVSIEGQYVIQNGDKTYVVQGNAILYEALLVFGEEKTGTFIVDMFEDNKGLQPFIGGVPQRAAIDPEFSENGTLLYRDRINSGKLTIESIKNMLVSEDMKNPQTFIQALSEGKAPVITQIMHLDTIDKKE